MGEIKAGYDPGTPSLDPAAPQWFTGQQGEIQYIGPSSVEAEFTLAATKSGDVGFSVKIEGDVTDDRIDKVTRGAARAALKMMETRTLLQVINIDPNALEAAKKLLGIIRED